jgi:hypothetical protein
MENEKCKMPDAASGILPFAFFNSHLSITAIFQCVCSQHRSICASV